MYRNGFSRMKQHFVLSQLTKNFLCKVSNFLEFLQKISSKFYSNEQMQSNCGRFFTWQIGYFVKFSEEIYRKLKSTKKNLFEFRIIPKSIRFLWRDLAQFSFLSQSISSPFTTLASFDLIRLLFFHCRSVLLLVFWSFNLLHV